VVAKSSICCYLSGWPRSGPRRSTRFGLASSHETKRALKRLVMPSGVRPSTKLVLGRADTAEAAGTRTYLPLSEFESHQATGRPAQLREPRGRSLLSRSIAWPATELEDRCAIAAVERPGTDRETFGARVPRRSRAGFRRCLLMMT
jgi:hypothetical protein